MSIFFQFPYHKYILVCLHLPTITFYTTVPPPTTSFLIPFSHASYSPPCRMNHFSFDLDTGSIAKSPREIAPCPLRKLHFTGSARFLERLQPFSSMVNLYLRSQLGLSAGWVMPPIWFFVSSHQQFIFRTFYVQFSCLMQGQCSWQVLPLESTIR